MRMRKIEVKELEHGMVEISIDEYKICLTLDEVEELKSKLRKAT